MKYLMFIKHSESYRNQPIPQALMDAMGEFVGFRVRSSKNRLTVTDGPFSEGKEVVGA